MAFRLTVLREMVDDITGRDATTLMDVLSVNRLIKAAIERYSRDRPDDCIEDETGDAGQYYPIYGSGALLVNWVEGFSRITAIEYPAATVASDEAPTYLEPEDWRDNYWYNSIRYLYLPNHAPAATETMRITYSVPYFWSASTSTTAVTQASHGFSVNDYVYADPTTYYKATDQRIATHKVTVVTDTSNFTAAELDCDVPPGDFFAVCHLAASFICQALASKFAKDSEPTLNADAVSHGTRSDNYRRQAKAFMDLYEQHIGTDEETRQLPASQFVDLNTTPGWPAGRGYLFHRGR